MTTSISSLTVQDLLSDAVWTRRLAFSLLGDRDSADDVVQETWIAAVQTRPDANQPLRPWLARVLRNRAATHRRDHARRAARHDRAAEVVGQTTSDASPETLLGRMQVQRVLAELITALPEPARQTVLLRYYEGLDSQQIGAIMGVPAGTVRGRLKQAIDQLRDDLDRRHQGNRESWRLALLPLGMPVEGAPAASSPLVSGTAWLSRFAIGLSIAGLAAGGVLLARAAGLGGKPPAAPGPGAAAPGGRGEGRWLAAALPATLDSCRPVLAARRKELAAAEVAYLGRAPKDVLFEEGAPNPTARAALLPEIERIASKDHEGVSQSLECRTYACRVLLVQPGFSWDTAGPKLMTDFASDPAVQPRLRGSGWLPGKETRDPISRATYTEVPIHLVLKTPSGAPVDGPTPPFVSSVADRPEPRTLEACQSELQAASDRLAYISRVNDGRMSLPERFRESEYDPMLRLEMVGVVAKALHNAGRTPDVLCRGQVCRLSRAPTTTSDAWRETLQRDPDFSRRINESIVMPEALLVQVQPGPSAPENRAATMLKTAREMFGKVDLLACAARAPAATGDLQVRLWFPVTRTPPQPGAPPPAIEPLVKGDLASTPVGACVQAAMNRIAAGTPVFRDFQGGSVTFARHFPLQPDAGVP
jgi:RNA polymerase sigma-70 factor (ECF subfamily)